MDNENSGETSKKKNSDICDNDRPLKKARYLWQVKGKYHLKDNTKLLSTNSKDKTQDSSEENMNFKTENNLNDNVHAVLNISNNNNITQAKNKNLCSDRSCIEALIANSDKIMDFPEPESPPKNIDKSILDEIPITLVKPNFKNEDYYLRKWQARQIAKGFVDNTINRVLENWMVAPFDAADFVENCDNGGQVEDEGILMAIQSHGLQSGIRDSGDKSLNSLTSSASLQSSYTSQASQAFSSPQPGSKPAWAEKCTCTRPRTETTQSSSLTPFHHRNEDKTEESNITLEYYENLCVLKDTEPIKPNYFSHSATNSSSEKNTGSSSHSEDSVEIDSSLITSEIDSETITDNSTAYESLKMNDTDFLDAAVAVAIQKKGLMSSNCVDCG